MGDSCPLAFRKLIVCHYEALEHPRDQLSRIGRHLTGISMFAERSSGGGPTYVFRFTVATSFLRARPMTARFGLIRTAPDINAMAPTGRMFGLNSFGGLVTRLQQVLALLDRFERGEFVMVTPKSCSRK